MGLGAGGRIRQEIYRDTFKKGDWRAEPSARVWVHLVAAGGWFALTGVKTVGTLPVGGLEHAGTVALPPGDWG